MQQTIEIERPFFYAQAAVDTMMRKFKAADLPPKGHFHYHQGVFLSGVYQIYLQCKNDEYLQYVKDWVDSVIDKEGNILDYHPGHLDDIQPGILFFPLYDAAGDEKYKRALDKLVPILLDFAKNAAGGFFHKAELSHQMWLDGLYMAGPVSAEYGYRYKKKDYLECAIEQALLMREKTEDKETGLWYHAWDESRRAEWANPVTGLSSEFWGRSIGWVPVAVLGELDFIPKKHPHYQDMCSLVKDLLMAVCRYQSEEGRWYQVVDKGGKEGNWLENSCSCLYVAAICNAVDKGILPSKYLANARRGYEAVINSLSWKGEDIQIGSVCIGTEVGDYKHYCERPVSTNDLHGVGAFLLMCAACERML